MQKSRANSGFTLIELVVVIVILGILAVTVAPKFLDIKSDAQTSTLQAVKASMSTASQFVAAKSMIANNSKKPDHFITSEGNQIAIKYGYPISVASTVVAATGAITQSVEDSWGLLLDINPSEFDVLKNATQVIIAPHGLYANGTIAVAAASCLLTYNAATATAIPFMKLYPCT
jgi:MSHA pilin protein MshA